MVFFDKVHILRVYELGILFITLQLGRRDIEITNEDAQLFGIKVRQPVRQFRLCRSFNAHRIQLTASISLEQAEFVCADRGWS
jgi:hypothetical protein